MSHFDGLSNGVQTNFGSAISSREAIEVTSSWTQTKASTRIESD